MPYAVSPEIVQQYDAFWKGQNRDALLSMSYNTCNVKREAVQRGLIKPWMVTGFGWALVDAVDNTCRTGDYSYVTDALKLLEHQISSTAYAGVGYPSIFINLGAGSLAAMLTGFAKPGVSTVWFELDEPWSYEKILSLEGFSSYAEVAMKTVSMLADLLDGQAIFSVLDLGGVADVLSSLRRTDGYLYDLYDSPERVKQASELILQFWFKAYDEIDALVRPINGPYYTHWIGLLAEKPFYPHQCDACAMIGPEQFRELVLPSLSAEMARFPATAYHLDGSGEICHLDALCEQPTLKVIQWVPEPNKAHHDESYYPLYKRIIELGRKIVFSGWRGSTDDMRRFFTALPRESFFITVDTKDDAERSEYLRIAEGR